MANLAVSGGAMPATYDRGSVRVEMKDVQGRIIRDRVRFTFVNQRVRSFDRRREVVLRGRGLTILGIPAGPVGLYQVFITPDKYREKSMFLMVHTDKPAVIEEVLFIDPGRAKARFPSYAALGQRGRWSRLLGVLEGSGITAGEYDGLEELAKAGIFNLFAKMSTTHLPDGTNVFDHVQKISEPKPARFYAQVSRDLLQLVRQDKSIFHVVPGALHPFPRGWRRMVDLGSFKTTERAGNLQLTFATIERGKFLVDADIDDHQGVEHAFDVLKHKVTGKDTHPYDIHEILVFFQGIDPGYEFG